MMRFKRTAWSLLVACVLGTTSAWSATICWEGPEPAALFGGAKGDTATLTMNILEDRDRGWTVRLQVTPGVNDLAGTKVLWEIGGETNGSGLYLIDGKVHLLIKSKDGSGNRFGPDENALVSGPVYHGTTVTNNLGFVAGGSVVMAVPTTIGAGEMTEVLATFDPVAGHAELWVGDARVQADGASNQDFDWQGNQQSGWGLTAGGEGGQFTPNATSPASPATIYGVSQNLSGPATLTGDFWNQTPSGGVTPGAAARFFAKDSDQNICPGATPGERITFGAEFANVSPHPIYGIAITDTLPAGLTYVDSDLDQVFGIDTNGNPVLVTVTEQVAGNTVTWFLGSDDPTASDYYENIGLPPGAGIDFEVVADETANAFDRTVYQNVLTADSGSRCDGAFSSMAQVAATNSVVVYRTNLDATKSATNLTSGGTTTVVPGDRVRYTIEVINRGSAPAENIRVEDDLPGGATLDPGSAVLPAGGTLTPTADGFAVEFPNLPSGLNARIEELDGDFTGALSGVVRLPGTAGVAPTTFTPPAVANAAQAIQTWDLDPTPQGELLTNTGWRSEQDNINWTGGNSLLPSFACAEQRAFAGDDAGVDEAIDTQLRGMTGPAFQSVRLMSNFNATFAFFFSPRCLSGRQVLLETGGTGSGTSFVLVDSRLYFTVSSDSGANDRVEQAMVDVGALDFTPGVDFIYVQGHIDLGGNRLTLGAYNRCGEGVTALSTTLLRTGDGNMRLWDGGDGSGLGTDSGRFGAAIGGDLNGLVTGIEGGGRFGAFDGLFGNIYFFDEAITLPFPSSTPSDGCACQPAFCNYGGDGAVGLSAEPGFVCTPESPREGRYTVAVTACADLVRWEFLDVDAVLPPGSDLMVEVLDPASNRLLGPVSAVDVVDLRTVPSFFQEVQLVFTLSATETFECNGPRIEGWKATWMCGPVSTSIVFEVDVGCAPESPFSNQGTLTNDVVETTLGDNNFFNQLNLTQFELGVNKSAATTFLTDCLTNYTFTIDVRNGGNGPATGVTVIDTLPDILTFVGASTNCVVTGRQVYCAIAQVPAFDTVTITLTTAVTDCRGQTLYTNAVEVLPTCGDGFLPNNQTEMLFTFDDSVAPVFDTFPPDLRVCGMNPGDDFGTPTVIDGCPVTLSSNNVVTLDGCTVRVERTWTATDLCGNPASRVQVIEIFNETDPPILVPPPGASGCGLTVTSTNFTNGVMAADGCSGVTNVGFTASTQTVDCLELVTRTWFAVDVCGNTASATQVITNVTDTLPTLTCPAVAQISRPSSNVLTTITAADLGVTLSSDCGIVATNLSRDTFSCTDVGVFSITVEVVNACGSRTSCVVRTQVDACQLPGLTLTKTVIAGLAAVTDCPGSNATTVARGDFVTYCFEIENSGDIEIENILLQDLDVGYAPPPLDLMPGTTARFVFQDQADDALLNTARVSGRTTNGTSVTDEDIAAVSVVDCDIAIVCPADARVECPPDTSPAAFGVATATVTCVASNPPVSAPAVWINEFHYDNGGTDETEFFEIAGTEGVDLSDHFIYIYNGNGGAVFGNPVPLGGVITNEGGCNHGTLVFGPYTNLLMNGAPDAFALVDESGPTPRVIEFLSYEGTFASPAVGGPADGMTPVEIVDEFGVGVVEDGGTGPNASIERVGTGSDGLGMTWANAFANSAGALNPGQTLTCPTGTITMVSSSNYCRDAVVEFTDTVTPGVCPVIETIERVWSARVDCAGTVAICTQVITVVNELQPTITVTNGFVDFGCIVGPPTNIPTTVAELEALGAVIGSACGSTNLTAVFNPTNTFNCVSTFSVDYTLTSACGLTGQQRLDFQWRELSAPTLVCRPDITLTFPAPVTRQTLTEADFIASADDVCGIATTRISQTTFDCANPGLVAVTVEVANACGIATSCVVNVFVYPCNVDFEVRKTVLNGVQPVGACGGARFTYAVVGDFVTYCFEIENTGDSVISNLVVSDTSITPPYMTTIPVMQPGALFIDAAPAQMFGDLINTVTVDALSFGVPLRAADTAEVQTATCDIEATCPASVVVGCTNDLSPAALGQPAGMLSCRRTLPVPDRMWVNEFHYDNVSTDLGEFIELAGSAGFDLGTVSVVLYDGISGAPYDTRQLSGVVPDQDCGFGTVVLSYTNRLNNYRSGIAVVHTVGGTSTVMHAIGYEGTFTGVGGPADGVEFTEIGVEEDNTSQAGNSLQLVSPFGTTGFRPEDFDWTGPALESPGMINQGQSILCTIVDTGILCQAATFAYTDTTNTAVDCQADGYLYEITRVWSSSVTCASAPYLCTQTITVVADQPPDLRCAQVEVGIGASGDVQVPAAALYAAFETCSPIASITPTGVFTFTCADLGSNTIPVTAVDECGNSVTCDAVVVVLQNTGSVLTCHDITVALDADGNASVPLSDIVTIDRSGVLIVATNQPAFIDFDCGDLGSNALVVSVMDACGLTSTCTAMVEVIDDIAPTFFCDNTSRTVVADDLLANPSFEQDEETTVFGQPGQPNLFRDWGGTLSDIVTGPQGQPVPVTPHHGTGMLEFQATGVIGATGNTRGVVVQYVNLAPLASQISLGGAEADLSAWFNRVAGDASTDTRFGLALVAHEGLPPPGATLPPPPLLPFERELTFQGGDLPSAEPDIEFIPTNTVETNVFTVTATHLEQDSISNATRAVYAFPDRFINSGGLRPDRATLMEVEFTTFEVTEAGGGFFEVYDGTNRYAVALTAAGAEIDTPAGPQAIAFPPGRHTMRIASGPTTDTFTVWLDGLSQGEFQAVQTAGLNGFSFGADSGMDTGARMNWYNLRVAQATTFGELFPGPVLGETFINTDANPLTWEQLTLNALIPVDADYLAIHLRADEDVSDDELNEFAGHFADSVNLVISLPPGTCDLAPLDLGCAPDQIPQPLRAADFADACGVTLDLVETIDTNGCDLTRTRVYTAYDPSSNSVTVTQTIHYIEDAGPPSFAGCGSSFIDLGCASTPAGIPRAVDILACATDDCGVRGGWVELSAVTTECSVVLTRDFFAIDNCDQIGTFRQVIHYRGESDGPVLTDCQVTTPVFLTNLVTNPGFETPEPTMIFGFPGRPATFNDWGGDNSAITGAVVIGTNNVAPRTGTNMLQLLNSGNIAQRGNREASVIQYIDLSPYTSQILGGNVSFRGRAWVNRVTTDANTDTQFRMDIRAWLGTPGGANTLLAGGAAVIRSDGDPSTWQELSILDIIIPAGASFLEIRLIADENIEDDGFLDTEFDGHFFDDVSIMLDQPECLDTVVIVGCDEDDLPRFLSPSNFVDACGGRIINPTTIVTRVTNDCGIIERRLYQAEDECGNVGQYRQAYQYFEDTRDPIWLSLPEDIGRYCGTIADVALLEVQPSVTDQCSAVSLRYFDSLEVLEQEYDVWHRRWVAQDVCGNTIEHIQRIWISRSPPTSYQWLHIPRDAEFCNVDTNALFTGLAVAGNNCELLEVTYLDFVTEVGCVDIISRLFKADLPQGGSILATQIVRHIVDLDPPSITIPPDMILCNGSNPTNGGFATGTDTCSDVVITYTDVRNELPECEFQIFRTWRATDFCGNFTEDQQVLLSREDPDPPRIAVPSDRTFCSDFSITNTNDVGEAFINDTCLLVSTSLVVNVTTADTGVIFFERVWTAEDACSNVAVATQTIRRFPDGYVEFTSFPGDITNCNIDVFGGGRALGRPTATNGCTDDIEFSVQNTLVDVIGCTQFIDRIWTALDTETFGFAVRTQRLLNVADDIEPVVVAPSNIIICGTNGHPDVAGHPMVEETCPHVIEYSDNVSSTACETVISRQWIVTDECGNVGRAVRRQLIRLREDTEPPIVEFPEDLLRLECTASTNQLDTGRPVVRDVCSGFSVSSTDTVTIAGCTTTIVRAWTIVDDCGNTTTGSQTLVLSDLTPPLLFAPADVFRNCPTDLDPANFPDPTVQDNCGGLVVDHTDRVLSTGCDFRLERTWTATDACGLTSTAVQNFVIQDNLAPIVTCADILYVNPGPDDRYLVPDVSTLVTAIDNCEVTISQSPAPGTLLGSTAPFGGLVTVTATDACGNETECDIVLTNGSCVGDFVWEDRNANGDPDAGEPPLPGVTVILFDSTGAEVSRTVTDTNGNYLFYVDPADPGNVVARGLPPPASATYQIGYNFPGYSVSPPFGVSVIDPTTGLSPQFDVTAGVHRLDQDFGLYQFAAVKGYVFEDLGGTDPNLTTLGINGVTVRLSRLLGGFEQLLDEQTTTTDTNNFMGSYCFDGLPPGTYFVEVEAANLAGIGLNPTTPTRVQVDLPSGGASPGNNFGFGRAPTAVRLASIDATRGEFSWTVSFEQDVLGYNVIDTATGQAVNEHLLLATGPGSAYAVEVGPGTYALEEIGTDLDITRHDAVTHYREIEAGPEGEPSDVLQAEEGVLEFDTHAGARNYFVRGVSATAVVLDVTDPDAPVRLLGDMLMVDGEHAAYFRCAPGHRIRVQ